MQYRIFSDFCQGLIADLRDEKSSAARRAPWHQRNHLRLALLYRHLGLTDLTRRFRAIKTPNPANLENLGNPAHISSFSLDI